MIDLPKSDPACFSAIQGGDYTSYTEVTPDFYQPIIDARKAQIGGVRTFSNRRAAGHGLAARFAMGRGRT